VQLGFNMLIDDEKLYELSSSRGHPAKADRCPYVIEILGSDHSSLVEIDVGVLTATSEQHAGAPACEEASK